MKLPEVLKRDYMHTVIMILIVILIVFIFWYGLRFGLRTEYPVLAVASGSMEPVLYEGDLIFVEGIESVDDIHAAANDADPPGDIIVFQGLQDLIVHRAIEKNNEPDGTFSFTTKGDANQWPDPRKVNEGNIVGKYTGFKVPLLGHIALFFASFEAKVAFIGLWILLLIILELVPLVRDRFRRSNAEESLYK